MANIKLTELTELLTVDNANTILYSADLSVSPNVSHYLRVGTISSLTDYSIANAAFLKANTAFSVGFNANSALNIANLAFAKGNVAHTQANTSTVTGQLAFNVGNSANILAQSGFNRANAAFVHANSAYNLSNTTTITSTSSFNRANVSFVHANSAYNLANSINITATTSLAQASFNKANTAVIKTGDVISGIITAPTAANNTSNTMLATTQFVNNAVKNAKLGDVPVVKVLAVVTISGTTATLTKGFNVATVSRLTTGRYLITFTNALLLDDYGVSCAISTFNPNNTTTRNFDHTINIESTTKTSITINTGDPGALPNNTGHDVSRFWITIFE